MKEIIKKLLISWIAIYCTVFVIFNTSIVQKYVSAAIERCVLTVIPSLFAMMAISSILIKSNVISGFSKIINPFSMLLGINGNIFMILIFSMIAGYPVGAKMISEEYERKRISKNQAELYSAVCFGAGPAFIFGCISECLFSGSNAGKIILISNLSVNFLFAVAISLITNRKKEKISESFIKLNSEIITDSAVSSGKNMFGICAMILLFSVFTCILDNSGLLLLISEIISDITGINVHNCGNMIRSILEVTNVGLFEKYNYTLLPFVCFAVSFGGICVVLQVRTVLNRDIKLGKFIVIRLISAILSGILCRIIMPYMLKNQVVSVSNIAYDIYSEKSPVPSYMLIVMIVMLFCKYRLNGKKI